MSKENNLTDFLADVADAIREKKGTSEKINPQDFSEEIKNLPSGEEVNTLGETIVDKIGEGLSVIKHVFVSEGVTALSAGAYKNAKIESIHLPLSLERLDTASLEGAISITELSIPDNVHTIGSYALKSCTSLKKIILPKSLTSVGNQCFMSDSALRSVLNMPKGVINIPPQCFLGCTALPSVTFFEHTSVPTLENINAFSNTTCQIVVPDNLYNEWIAATNWSVYADRIIKASWYIYLDFADPIAEKICADNFGDGVGTTQEQANKVTMFPEIFKGNTEITSFDELERFENVTSIAITAFDGCSKIKTVKIPNNVNKLSQSLFVNCISLEKVEISNNSRMSTIGFLCFDGCGELTSINIPSGVTNIGFYAFRNCKSLTKVTCRNSTPPTAGNEIFQKVPTATLNIYVPDESVDAYKSATNWALYADQIKPLSEYQSNNE